MAATQAQDIIDEAKEKANAEAKKIVIQTIQRVATEHSVENGFGLPTSRTTTSKAESSDAKDGTSARLKRQPVLSSSWTTHPRPSS